MHIPYRKSLQRGQAFLIVVLVMVVALTVGLSIASRSLTNVRLTTEEVNSQRAFSAAEAGVEQLLQLYGSKANQSGNINNITLDLGTGTKISNATLTPVSSSLSGGSYQLLLNNGAYIAQDDGYDIWLTTYNTDPTQLYQNPWPGGAATGHLTVYWGDPAANTCDPSPQINTMAALEIIVIYNNRTNPQVARYLYDPCSTGRQAVNNFTAVSSSVNPQIGGKTFLYKVTIGITRGLIARVIPLYASAVMGIATDAALPAQGQLITATGVSGASSEVKRQVSYFQAWDALPSEYYHALFVRE